MMNKENKELSRNRKRRLARKKRMDDKMISINEKN